METQKEDRNRFFGWILKNNPNFFEENGFKKLNTKEYHYFGNSIAKGNNHPVYWKHRYTNYDYEEQAGVCIFSANIGSVNHEYLMAIYEWNNAGGDSCPLKLVRLVDTIDKYNEIIKEWGLDKAEEGSFLLEYQNDNVSTDH